MGFAGALGKLGLPPNAYLLSLVMFNIGVELGQLTIILSAYFLLGKWFGNNSYYRKAHLLYRISTVIAISVSCLDRSTDINLVVFPGPAESPD